jgi:hypothetical protein
MEAMSSEVKVSLDTLKLALEVLELAKNSHGRMLLSDPPQEAWKTYRVDDAIKQSTTGLRQSIHATELREQAQKQITSLQCAHCQVTIDTLNDKVMYLMEQAQKANERSEVEPVAGWTGNTNADSALVMLDRLDVSPDDDDRVDEISKIVRELASPPPQSSQRPMECKPLTVDEIWQNDELMVLNAQLGCGMDLLMEVVEAVEAAHGIYHSGSSKGNQNDSL